MRQIGLPDSFPLVEELTPLPDAEAIFARLALRPHCLFLDSAMRDPVLGRYSFLAADPFDYFEQSADDADSFAELARRVTPYVAATAPGLPPFQGGAAGLLGYDLNRQLERLPQPAHDEFRTPAMAIGLYDVVVAIDHVEKSGWIISQGFPELEPAARHRRAVKRLEQFRSWITGAAA